MAAKANDNGVNPSGKVKVCKDCKLSFSDIYAYTDHLETKQHIKRVMKNKYSEKYLETKAKLNAKNSEENSETSFDMLSAFHKKVKKCEKVLSEVAEKPVSTSNDDSDDDEVYACEVCEKVCTGLITYQLHLEGKKHKKNMKKQALLKQMEEQNMIPVLNDEPREETLFERLFPESRHMDCKVCKKTRLGPEAFRQHCKSASHQKKVALEEFLKGQEAEDLSPVKAHDEDNPSFAQCVTCNKTFSGPLPQMQHLKSISHLKQVRRMEELGLIQNLIVSKKEDSKFTCKVCGKMFSGPVPFNTHLMSSAHGKLKKKSDLTEKLKKEHPEFIKTHETENSNDIEDDKVVFLGCNVCKVVFSGPEAANDHFTSPNHKKAKKQKEMFKKFKQQQKAGKLRVTSDGSKAKKSESDDSSDFEEEFDIIQE